MVWIFIILLFMLWLLGVIFKVTAGGWIHVLIIVATIILVVSLIKSSKNNLSR
ncbi:MAG: lmo0937 family membrane protein [Ignavibacteriaceae bacterium]